MGGEILVGPALIEEQEFRTSLPFLRIPKVFAMQILAELKDAELQLRHRLVSDDDHEFGQPDQCRGPEPTLSRDEPSVFAGQHRLKLFDLERFTELAEVRLLEVLSRLRADLEPTERFETEGCHRLLLFFPAARKPDGKTLQLPVILDFPSRLACPSGLY